MNKSKNGFSEMLGELAEIEELEVCVKNKITPLGVNGVSNSLRAHLAFCVSEKLDLSVLMVTETETSANELAEDLSFFTGGDVLRFPYAEPMFYDVDARSRDLMGRRLSALFALASGSGRQYIVCSYSALLGSTLPYEKYIENALTLRPGDDIELDELCARFAALGYKREDIVENAGQFGVRGGIVDFFPFGAENPTRIEFFDTEVDSIRIFDKDSQRTVEMIDKAELTPAAELALNADEREALALKLEKEAKKTDNEFSQNYLMRDAERLRQGISFPSLDKYIPYIYNKEIPTIIDYLPKNTAVFLCSPSRISESAANEERRFAEDLTDLAERGIIMSAKVRYSLDIKKALRRLTANNVFIGISGLSETPRDYKPKRTLSLTAKSLAGFGGKSEYFYESLRFYKSQKYRIIILGGSEKRARNLCKQLSDEGFSCGYTENIDKDIPQGAIEICRGSLSGGYELPTIRTVIISDREIFGREKKKKRRRAKIDGKKIDSFTDLSEGDYIVHRNYGIGQYVGIEQLSVEGVRKDYLKIRFKGEDMLYVPTDQMGMIYKHTVRDGARVKLNKLGGGEWNRTKQRVKAAAEDMAKELIALYAKRTSSPGIEFPKDSDWQAGFEARFPYEETDDQLRSINEVKSDMEKPYPMDRLLCGDVGYGKTEVALRAAFKAVTAGYQVAYLVPTTILCNQHFGTFRQRMKDYPINVAMLSRFCTPAEEKRVTDGLLLGEIDIVIGTHKLLSSKVRFNKLGLLVIDEEQRFGVAHKERIKEIRRDVDVLTLSATPIPRTLHMSLTGIRDMSIISEPPAERFPVSTYVMEYDENVILEAINKELGRGGQVYYLHNRTEGIFKTADRLAKLVPNARVAAAHGRMHENELEQIMNDMMEGDVDILVCTTIIETGLDIGNVNTLIVEDADRLGLAQLYQLRGRVGRSNRPAYAYLTYRRNKMLTPEAEKRLLAIKEFTEFGSGFKIAMRDLEIRGAGNLIGAEQHGHMDAVGYEMYCSLLDEAKAELSGEVKKTVTETQIDIPVTAYISSSYITDHSRRLAAYRRIAAIKTEQDLMDCYDELEDRYGTVPPETDNLMQTALIKAYASAYGAAELIGNDKFLNIRLDPDNIPDMSGCLSLMEKRPGYIKLLSPASPVLRVRLAPEKGKEAAKKYLAELKKLFAELNIK